MNSTDRDIIEEIFRSVFELDQRVAVDSIERSCLPGWDSMAQVGLLSAIDDEFELVISSDDALEITSFARCVEILDKYIES